MLQEMVSIFGIQKTLDLLNRNNGHSLEYAPNGQKSILLDDLINTCFFEIKQALEIKAKVYSDEFLKWFGDWRCPTNESIAADENGEPLLVYRTVKNKDATNKPSNNLRATFFTDNRKMAATYNDSEYRSMLIKQPPGGYTTVGFINITDAKTIDAEGRTNLQVTTSKYIYLADKIVSMIWDNKSTPYIRSVARKISNCNSKRIRITNVLSKTKLKEFIRQTGLDITLKELIAATEDYSLDTITDEFICDKNVVIKNIRDYAKFVKDPVPATDYIINDYSNFKSIYDLNI